MLPLRIGFNPNLRLESRRRLHEQLRRVVDVAVRLEFQIVELNLTTSMYDLGLDTVYDAGVFEILDSAPVRFNLNVFRDTSDREWPAISDVNAYSRSIALRQLVQIVEHFERRHAMTMYVVHPGQRVAPEASHVDAVREGFRTLHNLYPGLPIAVANAPQGDVLGEIDSVLEMLDASADVRLALHTGLAFHSVDADHMAFETRMRYLRRFSDRLAEIRWHNTAPGRHPSVPLHVALERGIDLGALMRTIGRNPGTVHMIDTVGLNPAALVREVRMLNRALSR